MSKLNNDIASNILTAVEIIADEKLKRVGFDKTIKATIISCEDSTTGKYRCQYQNAMIYAYASDTTTNYSNGTLVYILVPENDMSNIKTIIGTVDKVAIEPGDLYQVFYDEVGSNIIESAIDFPYALHSYIEEENLVLYEKNGENNKLTVNNAAAALYLKDTGSLLIKADVRTTLPKEQQMQGDFGLKVTLSFASAVGGTNDKEYFLNVNAMEGNPYQQTCWTTQKLIADIDAENFIEIKKIEFYENNFPNQKLNPPADLFINNIALNGVKRLTTEETTGLYLSILSPEGTYFTGDIEELKLNAKLRNNGSYIDFADDAFIYWYAENGEIVPGDPRYESHGGAGWECLNPRTADSTDAAIFYEKAIPSLLVSIDDVLSKRKYKCVVLQGGYQVSKEVTIINLNAQYSVEVTSDGGTVFYFDAGLPILTCTLVSDESLTNPSFAWTVTDSNGITNQIVDNPPKYVVGEITEESYQDKILTKQTCRIRIADIFKFSKYTCAVYEDGEYIGSGDIQITNSYVAAGDAREEYSLVINNGNKLYMYDEQGYSPASSKAEQPISIIPLTYNLYDLNGSEVTTGLTSTWYVPVDNTMIELENPGSYQQEIINEINYYVVTGPSLNYLIANTYNVGNSNNEVRLTVNSSSGTFNAVAALNFAKQGESGSNGTDVFCRIVPNSITTPPEYPICAQDAEGNILWNYNFKEYNTPFKVLVWQNGELINNGYTVEWSMVGHRYNSSLSTTSFFEINRSTGRVQVLQDTWNYADSADLVNIVQCAVALGEYVCYASLPIITEKVEEEIISVSGGFKTATYLSDGTYGLYDNRLPFAVVDNEELTYTWEVFGGYQDYNNGYEWKSNPLLTLVDMTLDSQKKANIASYFNGIVLNNAILCTIEGIINVTIHIPIHFLFNRYGKANINDWNGNNIQINDEGGFILAPQVGAGHKEEDNSFTGVILGDIQETNQGKETGFMAFKDGVRTVFIDAETGEATFGDPANQIKITPEESTIHFTTEDGKIYSGEHDNFDSSEEGFYLSSDGLSIGENFWVDKDGEMHMLKGYIGNSAIVTEENLSMLDYSKTAWKLKSYPIVDAEHADTENFTGDGTSVAFYLSSTNRYADISSVMVNEYTCLEGEHYILFDSEADNCKILVFYYAPAAGAEIKVSYATRYYTYLTAQKNFVVSNDQENGHTLDNDATGDCQIGSLTYPWGAGYFQKIQIGFRDLNWGQIVRNLGLRLLSEPSDVRIRREGKDVYISWKDPSDLTGDKPIKCIWAGTALMRSDSQPAPWNRYQNTNKTKMVTEITDDNQQRNYYDAHEFHDVLQYGKRYFYGIFPYDTNGYTQFNAIYDVDLRKGFDSIVLMNIYNMPEVGTSGYPRVLYGGDHMESYNLCPPCDTYVGMVNLGGDVPANLYVNSMNNCWGYVEYDMNAVCYMPADIHFQAVSFGTNPEFVAMRVIQMDDTYARNLSSMFSYMSDGMFSPENKEIISSVDLPGDGEYVEDLSLTYSGFCKNLSFAPVCGPNVTNMFYSYYDSGATGTAACGDNVTNLAYAYYNCSKINTAVCGNNVTNMSYSYYNTGVTEVVCGDKVINMSYAYGNTKVTDGYYGPNVKFSYSVFQNCPINKIYWQNNLNGSEVLQIYQGANCYNVYNAVNAPMNITELNEYPYSTYWGSPFNRLINAACGDSVVNMTRSYAGQSMLETGACGANVINMNATYADCINLTNITLGDNVRNMTNTFNGCSNLTDISIPNNIETMYYTFENCQNLKNVNFNYWVLENLTNIDYAFHNCHNLKNCGILYDGMSSVKSAYGAFQGCTNISSACFGENLTNISYMYDSCWNLMNYSLDMNLGYGAGVTQGGFRLYNTMINVLPHNNNALAMYNLNINVASEAQAMQVAFGNFFSDDLSTNMYDWNVYNNRIEFNHDGRIIKINIGDEIPVINSIEKVSEGIYTIHYDIPSTGRLVYKQGYRPVDINDGTTITIYSVDAEVTINVSDDRFALYFLIECNGKYSNIKCYDFDGSDGLLIDNIHNKVISWEDMNINYDCSNLDAVLKKYEDSGANILKNHAWSIGNIWLIPESMTIKYEGTGAPITPGEFNGDYYLDTTSGRVYEWYGDWYYSTQLDRAETVYKDSLNGNNWLERIWIPTTGTFKVNAINFANNMINLKEMYIPGDITNSFNNDPSLESILQLYDFYGGITISDSFNNCTSLNFSDYFQSSTENFRIIRSLCGILTDSIVRIPKNVISLEGSLCNNPSIVSVIITSDNGSRLDSEGLKEAFFGCLNIESFSFVEEFPLSALFSTQDNGAMVFKGSSGYETELVAVTKNYSGTGNLSSLPAGCTKISGIFLPPAITTITLNSRITSVGKMYAPYVTTINLVSDNVVFEDRNDFTLDSAVASLIKRDNGLFNSNGTLLFGEKNTDLSNTTRIRYNAFAGLDLTGCRFVGGSSLISIQEGVSYSYYGEQVFYGADEVDLSACTSLVIESSYSRHAPFSGVRKIVLPETAASLLSQSDIVSLINEGDCEDINVPNASLNYGGEYNYYYPINSKKLKKLTFGSGLRRITSSDMFSSNCEGLSLYLPTELEEVTTDNLFENVEYLYYDGDAPGAPWGAKHWIYD